MHIFQIEEILRKLQIQNQEIYKLLTHILTLIENDQIIKQSIKLNLTTPYIAEINLVETKLKQSYTISTSNLAKEFSRL